MTAAVTLVSDAAATLTATQSAADGGPVGNNDHAVKIGSPIKLKPKTLVFRRIRRYYSSRCGLSIDDLTFVT